MEEKQDLKLKKLKSAIIVGSVGGIFWTMLGYLAYFMNFTLIGPSIFIKPFIASSYLHQPSAHFAGIAIATLLSILVAMAYVYSLSAFYSPWIGVGMGMALFLIFFYVLNPLLNLTKKPIHEMGWNTFSTEICLFIIYGLFIGFSLSAEYSGKEDERAK